MNKTILLVLFIFAPSLVFSQAEKSKTQEEKERELVDFNSIKDVLKNDQLTKEIKKKDKKIKKIVKKRTKVNLGRYNIPGEEDFWSFFSEYWLVKNAPILKWDFQKPDYGVEETFKFFLEKLGHYEKSFKILYVNSPSVFHFAIPSNPDEYIFLISVPFIRTLDLTKLEISLLLFENYLRLKRGYFKKRVRIKELDGFIGGNFHDTKKLNKAILKKVAMKYDEVVFDKGFSFKEQFQVTKEMGNVLKSDLKLWNTYYKMLGKIDDLVKSNILYRTYNRIYPSPEMQINWLKPKNKIL